MANPEDISSGNDLVMTFMPSTIEHLGARLYSTIPPIVAELIANSLDADANNIHVALNDAAEEKTIIVKDDGNGMSLNEINIKFLRIGRNRRLDAAGNGQVSPHGRPVIGKKGLGKLSFFGIAKRIEVSTIQNSFRNIFVLDWDEIIKDQSEARPITEYKPTIIESQQTVSEPNGTTITLHEIQRRTDFDAEKLANSLSRFFIVEEGVHITIQHNESNPIELDNSRRYLTLDIEFKWNILSDIPFAKDSQFSNKVSGEIYTTKKPIPPNTNLRGITLFSRNKLVNLPEYFSESASSHFFSYVSGWLQVDFIEDLDIDVIETNRQSLNWEHPEMQDLRAFLKQIVSAVGRSWRERRQAVQMEKLTDKSKIDVEKWKTTVPQEVKDDLDPLLNALSQSIDIPEKEDQTIQGFEHLYKLVPEYPLLHWRHLDPDLQGEVQNYYQHQDYYMAVLQGALRYINCIMEKAELGEGIGERNVIEKAFAERAPVLAVVDHYRKPDGTSFKPDTLSDISHGHRKLALALWEAFRNPLGHETARDLNGSDLFSEKDCLDALSILSHLFRRLHNATVVPQETTDQ